MALRTTVSGWLIVALILGQLSILQVKELREQGSELIRNHAFFGYAPTLLAALTLPCFFLAMSLNSRRHRADEPYGWARLWREDAAIAQFLGLAVGGLVAWEFVQVYRPNRTFDWQDVWATLAGALAFLATVLVARGLTTSAGGTSGNANARADAASQEQIP